MKIMLLYSFYDRFLHSVYACPGSPAHLPFAGQIERIVGSYFGDACSFYRHLEKQGHEPFLVVPNCRDLQIAWAHEAGFEPGSDWMFSIPAEQICRIQPDVLYVCGLFPFYGDFFRMVKPFCRRIVSWIAYPYPANLDFGEVSLVFTSHPSFQQGFQQLGIRSEIVPAAFDADVLQLIPAEDRDIPFSFIGGISPDHAERFRLLSTLVGATSLELWGYGIDASGFRDKIRRLFAFGSMSNPLAARYHGEAWGLDMYRVLNRSRITFNVHIDIAGDWCGNMRMYEATGSGTLLLTDRKKNLPELFEPDKEVVPYDSLDDAIDKVRYYLEHDDERSCIAIAGQERTLRDYSFSGRVERIVDILNSELTT